MVRKFSPGKTVPYINNILMRKCFLKNKPNRFENRLGISGSVYVELLLQLRRGDPAC